MPQIKLNGGPKNGEWISGNIQFFTLYTVASMAVGSVNSATPTNVDNLEKLLNFVSTRTQPLMVSVASAAVDLSVAGNRTIYGLGTDFNQAATTIFTVKFAVDKTDVWNTTGTTADNLIVALDGFTLPFTTSAVPITGPSTRNISAFDTQAAAAKNISITKFDVL